MFVADLNSFWWKDPVKFASLGTCSAWLLLATLTVMGCVFHIWIFSCSFLCLSSYLSNSLSPHEVLFQHRDADTCPQENSFIRKHEPKLLVTDGSTSANDQRINQHLVLLGSCNSVFNDVSDLLEHLLHLWWQNAHEDDVALSSYLLVVENTFHSKFLLERPQKMRLSCRNYHL